MSSKTNPVCQALSYPIIFENPSNLSLHIGPDGTTRVSNKLHTYSCNPDPNTVCISDSNKIGDNANYNFSANQIKNGLTVNVTSMRSLLLNCAEGRQ